MKFFFSMRKLSKVDEREKMQKSRPPIKQEVKTTLKEFLTTTPIHGLPHIMNTKSWYMKTFWIIFTAGLFGFGIWLVVKAFSDYLEYPVVSEVEENVETQMEFPAVTLCNLNPFSTKYATEHVRTKLSDLFSPNELARPLTGRHI